MYCLLFTLHSMDRISYKYIAGGCAQKRILDTSPLCCCGINAAVACFSCPRDYFDVAKDVAKSIELALTNV